MGGPGETRQCPTCRRPLALDAFYEGCAECKECKRNRSRQHRAQQARKLAAFERFVDALINLADQTPQPAPDSRGISREAAAS